MSDKPPLNPFYDSGNDVERIFRQDVVEKKTTGRGIHGRARRLRKHEALVMPSERLSGIEKIDYTRAGIVTLSRIGDKEFMEMLQRIKTGEIPSIEEIEQVEKETNFETAQKIVAEIRRLHKNDVLKEAWGLKYNNFNKYVYDRYQTARTRSGQVFVGEMAVKYVQTNYYNEDGNSKKGETMKVKKEKNQVAVVEPQEQQQPIYQQQIQQAVIISPQQQQQVTEGFNFSIKKNMVNVELERLLGRLSLFVTKETEDEENTNFEVEITIRTA